jgi:signal transduction histidine kinase
MDDRADVRGSPLNSQDHGTGNGEQKPPAAPDLLMRTMEGRLTFWPAGMEQRYGFTSEQALGHVSHQLLKTIYPQALNEIEEILLRQSNWTGGLIHRHADGRAVMVVGHWYLHRNAEGYDAVISEVHSDAVGQQLGDLIAVLAHELSQPLAAITGYIDGAQRILERAWPDLDTLRKSMVLAADQIARGAEGVKLMRHLADGARHGSPAAGALAPEGGRP